MYKMLYLQQINSMLLKWLTTEKCFHCGEPFHSKCLVDKIKFGIENIVFRACMAKEILVDEPSIGESETIFEDRANFLKPNGLKIFHQNVSDLIKKLVNVNLLLTETKRSVDILGITETHLRENIGDIQATKQ